VSTACYYHGVSFSFCYSVPQDWNACVDFLQGTVSALIRLTAPPTSTVAFQSERYEHDPVFSRNVEISFQNLRIVTPKVRVQQTSSSFSRITTTWFPRFTGGIWNNWKFQHWQYRSTCCIQFDFSSSVTLRIIIFVTNCAQPSFWGFPCPFSFRIWAFYIQHAACFLLPLILSHKLHLGNFFFIDLWDLHDQGQGQCDAGGRAAAWNEHACCGILHVWQFLHGNRVF